MPVFAQQRVDLGVMWGVWLIAHGTQHRRRRCAAAVRYGAGPAARHPVQRAVGGTGGTGGSASAAAARAAEAPAVLAGGGGTSFLKSSAPSRPPSVVNATPTTSMNRNPKTRPKTSRPDPWLLSRISRKLGGRSRRRVEEALGELPLPHAGHCLQRHVQDRPDDRAHDAGEQAGERAVAERDRERLVLLHQPRRQHAGGDEPQPAAAVPRADDRQRRKHAEQQAGQERGLQPEDMTGASRLESSQAYDSSLRMPCRDSGSVVVLEPEVRDELLARHVAQRVLQLHQLDEQIVLRIQLRARAAGS